MHTRKAARVFPDPVGAAISVFRPPAISLQPPNWGGVGPSGNRRWNHVRMAGWNDSSIPALYRPPPTRWSAGETVESLGALESFGGNGMALDSSGGC
jgi:hypothetical protein